MPERFQSYPDLLAPQETAVSSLILNTVTKLQALPLPADEVGQQFYSDDMKRRMAAVDPSLISTTWPQFNK